MNKAIGLILVILSGTSYIFGQGSEDNCVQKDSICFDTFAQDLYSQIEFCEDTLDQNVFNYALRGYLKIKEKGQLNKDSILVVIDYSLSSKKKRLWIINLKARKVEFNEYVAHGKNSGGEYARYFSNTYRSRKSSLGFMVTGEIYNGKHKLSLKLNGLEYGFNTNVFGRGVVIHGASYVNARYAEDDQSMGRSFGCPAVCKSVNEPIVRYIEGGTCVFAYYPNSHYLKKSKYISQTEKISVQTIEDLLSDEQDNSEEVL